MARPAGLAVAVAILFGVMGALGYFAFTRIRHPDTRGLASAPRDSIAVVYVDVARLRTYEPAQRVRRALLAGPDATRDYAALTTACGFDPSERVDAAMVTFDHALLGGSTTDVGAVLLDARAMPAQTSQCVTALARGVQSQTQVVSAEPMRGHPVLAIVLPGGTLGASSARVVELTNRVALGTQTSLAHLLDVLERRQPGADRNELLRATTTSLGDALLAYAVVDVQSALQLVPRDMLALYAQTVALTAGGTPMPPLTSLRSVALALQRTPNDGLRLECVSVYDTDATAQSASAAVRQGFAMLRGVMAFGLAEGERAFTQEATELGRDDPTIAPQAATVRLAYPVLEGGIDRVQTRAEGPQLHIDLALTRPEVDTLIAAAAAARAVDAAQTRAHEPPPVQPPPPPTPLPRVDIE